MTDRDLKAVLDKAAKLRALAGSSNVNEAALAAAKLQELLFKYNLDASQVKDKDKPGYKRMVVDLTPGGPKTITNWKRGLIHVVAMNNFCRSINIQVDKRQIETWLIGEPHNMEVVRQMYAYLLSNVLWLAERDWKTSDTRKLGGAKIRWLNAFYEGAVTTIWLRLKAQRAQDMSTSGGHALVVIKDREIEDLMEDRFGKTHALARSTPSSNAGFKDGLEAAKEIGLGVQVGGSSSGIKELAG